MATDKQIAANRANAQLCTGPRSETGHAISSQNALKHGLDSKSEVMRCENRADYETLIAEYYERFHPTIPEERCLVDMLIKSEWLSRRYMSIDAMVWDRGLEVTNQICGRKADDQGQPGIAYERMNETLARVDRRINSAQRNFQHALKQLMDLRTKRAKEPALDLNQPDQTAEPDATAVATEPLNPKLVSFLTPDSEPTTPPAQPAESAPAPTASHPEKEDDPPIAA